MSERIKETISADEVGSLEDIMPELRFTQKARNWCNRYEHEIDDWLVQGYELITIVRKYGGAEEIE